MNLQSSTFAEIFAYIPYLFVAAPIGLWFAAMALLARLGGWSALAECYDDDALFEGKKRRFQSLVIKRGTFPASYNSIVNIGADGAYLYLSVFLLFRPFHPSLKIPLAELSRSEARWFTLKRTALRPQRTPDVCIVISQSLADWIFGSAAAA